MKKLTIKTERIFRTEEEWQAYIHWTPLKDQIDIDELETKGKFILRDHKPWEIVESTYTLEELK